MTYLGFTVCFPSRLLIKPEWHRGNEKNLKWNRHP